MTGVSTWDAIIKIFAANGVTPRIVLDPSKPPSWNSKTAVVTLPALPQNDMSEEDQAKLRAWAWHEVQGEQQINTWQFNEWVTAEPRRQRLANGIGDALIDNTMMRARPGAGIDIRTQVITDYELRQKEGRAIEPSVGIAAAMCRYVLEGITTWDQLKEDVPLCEELIEYLEVAIPPGTTVATADDVLRLTRSAEHALSEYEADEEAPEEPEPDEPEEGAEDGGGDGTNRATARPSGGAGKGSHEVSPAASASAPIEQAPVAAPQAPPKARTLADGVDSHQSITKALSEALKTGGLGSGATARSFDEARRTVVRGTDIDRHMAQHGMKRTEFLEKTKHEGQILANRLRMALTGPTMKQERQQEYGRLDPRRLANAMAGSRTVYERRRELPGEQVAIAVAWDESGSMGGGPIERVRALVGRLAVAVGQMPNLTAEFVGWTDGVGADEIPNSARLMQRSPGGQNETAVHRIYKAFDEPIRALEPRIGMIFPRLGTPMCQGLGFSARRLSARPEHRKVLFFLTDGQAASSDTSEQTPWGYNALAYEVDRAVASGVDVVVVVIGTDYEEKIDHARRCLGDYAHVVNGSDMQQRAIKNLEDTHKSVLAQYGPNAAVVTVSPRSDFARILLERLVRALTYGARRAAANV